MAAYDPKTRAFYREEAERYAHRDRKPPSEKLNAFVERLPNGAKVLELGCGAGQDTEFLLEAGLDVHPTDGSPEMAEQASERLGRPVSVMLFEELEELEAYDGVWACACLLHVPRDELEGIMQRIARALKPGGVLYANWKAGDHEGRDKFDRYYNYPDEPWLQQILASQNWTQTEISENWGTGYDGNKTRWLHLFATK